MERIESRAKWLVYLLPLLLIPWQSGGSSALAKFVDLAALTLILVLMLRSGVTLPRIGKTAALYMGLVAWSTLSIIWSVNRYQSVMWVTDLILVGATVLAVRKLAVSDDIRKRIVSIYLVVAVLTSIWGMYIYLTDSYERLTGPFYLANPMAAFLLPALVLALARFGKKFSLLVFVETVAIGSAIVLADSRTAFLTAIVETALLAYIFRRNIRRSWVRLVILAVAILALVLALGLARTHIFRQVSGVQPGSRFAEAAEGKSTSGSDRLYFLRSTFAIWRDHPLLGTGAGTFSSVHPKYQERTISASKHAHNFYAETLSELGTVGIILLILLFVSFLYDFRAINKSRTTLVFGIIILFIVLHYGLDIETYFPAITLSLALLIGLLYSDQPYNEEGKRLGLMVPAAVLIVLAMLMYMQVRAQSHHSQALFLADDGDISSAESEESKATSLLFFEPDYRTKDGIYLYTLASIKSEAERSKVLLEALNVAKKAQKNDSADAQNYQLEGRIRISQNDTKGAESAFRTSLRLDPYDHPEYALNLAALLISLGRKDEGISVAQSMLKQYTPEVIANRSNDSSIANNLANLYALIGVVKRDEGDITLAKQAVAEGLKLNSHNLRVRALAESLKDR